MTDEPDMFRLPIEDVLDLHAFAPGDVPAVVADYVEEAAARGFREVRIVHGRGIGVQRAVVHRALSRHPRVIRFWDAPESHLGATLAQLAVGR
jgi:DNA-nicking Smr family endonuclease